jgi:hypothetical protein
MLRVIFCVVSRRVMFNSRRFGTLSHTSYPIAYEDGTDSVPKRQLLNTTRRETTQKITRNKQNPRCPEALHFLTRMPREGGWNFGQVPAAVAELARNLPTFLQANFESSALERTRRFIHKPSEVH